MATLREMRSETLPSRTDPRWFHKETVTDATSEPVILPSLGREAAVAVSPGTNAKVQYTLSSYDAIADDTAVWHDWPAGAATEAAVDSITGAASALRLVSTGTSSWEITV
ncbi:hypothetical protein [Halomonas koreensis]|uniref:Uncharacterized protein n=1 Tax=Halomonas koreensis TaxID=245385 RepID=A0ABU1G2X0_9GAMM|nr:hypothetical protein [Halomonas koreensis]MDR5867299.1 hypothetical protein [Halomonas koreensis]